MSNEFLFLYHGMMVNKSGHAAGMSSASGVNGLSSCSRMDVCSKGVLNTIKLQ